MAHSLVSSIERDMASKVIWRPFILRPEIPPVGAAWQLTDGERGAFERAISERSRGLNLEIALPAVRPHTDIALEAAEYASSVGLGQEFREATFDAYWREGRNIGQKAVVQEIATEVGLDADTLKISLEFGVHREEVLASTKELQDLPYAAIPTFLMDEFVIHGFLGAERVRSTLLALGAVAK